MVGPELPDLIAGLASLISIIGFVQYWKPKYRPEFAAALASTHKQNTDEERNVDNGSSVNEEAEAATEDSSKEKQSEKAVTHNENVLPTKLQVEKLSWWETFMGWSPWLIIVVVVIM